jgi:hypothetical protein
MHIEPTVDTMVRWFENPESAIFVGVGAKALCQPAP